jgi:hypothetical protein
MTLERAVALLANFTEDIRTEDRVILGKPRKGCVVAPLDLGELVVWRHADWPTCPVEFMTVKDGVAYHALTNLGPALQRVCGGNRREELGDGAALSATLDVNHTCTGFNVRVWGKAGGEVAGGHYADADTVALVRGFVRGKCPAGVLVDWLAERAPSGDGWGVLQDRLAETVVS